VERQEYKTSDSTTTTTILLLVMVMVMTKIMRMMKAYPGLIQGTRVMMFRVFR
jgi:hypothetical protein